MIPIKMIIFAVLLETNVRESYWSNSTNLRKQIDFFLEKIPRNEFQLIDQGYVFHCYKTGGNRTCLVSDKLHDTAFSLIKHLVHNTLHFNNIQDLTDIGVNLDEIQIVIHNNHHSDNVSDNDNATSCIII